MRSAIMFSGQGSQNPGMGKELYDDQAVFRDIFDRADLALDFSVTTMCFGDDPRLNETQYAQPCILAHSIACYELLKSKGFNGDVFLGLSLGEYTALTAAGVFGFAEALRLVRKRGIFISEACATGDGGMSAIMGLSPELAEKACFDASDDRDLVSCANFNTPGQIVIAGSVNALGKAEKLCLDYGAKRALRLNVSGPFHTEYLRPAANKLKTELAKLKLGSPGKPVISNLTAREISGDIINNLIKHMVSPVRFEESVNYLISQGVDTFIELGPGKTLCSFVKKINKNLRILNIEDNASLENTLSLLGSDYEK